MAGISPDNRPAGLFPAEPAQYSAEDYILMSLQPYAFRMMEQGTKRYEFRTRFRKQRCIAFIYLSSPVRAISAVLRLGSPLFGTAREIADLAEGALPGNGVAIYQYLAKNNRGYAIEICGLLPIAPLPLSEARRLFNFRPPQSYYGLSTQPALLSFLAQRAGIVDLEYPHSAFADHGHPPRPARPTGPISIS